MAWAAVRSLVQLGHTGGQLSEVSLTCGVSLIDRAMKAPRFTVMSRDVIKLRKSLSELFS